MQYVRAFIAGFLATLIFHQGIIGLLHAADPSVPAPFNMEPTHPLQIPAVISLAFWGGLWGVVLWVVVRGFRGAMQWAGAIVLGALLPSLGFWFVVLPLKGYSVMGGGDPKLIGGALLVNAVWGFGVLLIMRGLKRVPGLSPS